MPTGADASHSLVSRYYPAFDGLRGLAILWVFFAHYGPLASPIFDHLIPWPVDLFFVLSGFLITGILFDSRLSPRYFHNFYIRRALRILPLYWGFFLVLCLLTPVLGLQHGPSFWVHFAFVANYLNRVMAVHHYTTPANNPLLLGIPAFGRLPAVTMDFGHLWSMCVEEQFYLIWPLLVVLAKDRVRLMRLAAALLCLSVLARCTLYRMDFWSSRTLNLYWSTHTHSDTLLIGSLLALWIRGRSFTRSELRLWSSSFFAIGAGVVLLGLFTLGRAHPFDETNRALQTFGYTFLGVAGAGVVLRSIDEESRLHHALRTPWLAHVGRISYGLYFWHNLPRGYFAYLRHAYLPGAKGWFVLPLAFGVSYLAAVLSFRFLESPFLKLKSRLAPTRHRSIPTGNEETPQDGIPLLSVGG